MPRNPTKPIRGQVWLPKEGASIYDMKINGISVRTDYIFAEFIKLANPEVGGFKISIINAAGEYNGKFNQNDAVQLYVDRVNGTTLEYLGYIDKIENSFKDSYSMEISGTHITGKLMDVLVTAKFTGLLTVNNILNQLKNSYLDATWTLSATSTYATLPVKEWNETPLWDCINDLCTIAGADCFVDDDKTIYFFNKLAKENNNEAIVWNQTLIAFPNLGYQSLTAKNTIKVYGDDGTGLPVIYKTTNTTSKTAIGAKEIAIFNSDISSYQQAKEFGIGQLNLSSTIPDQLEGEVQCFLMETLNPTEKIWITHPKFNIHGQYKVYKVTHKFPEKNTLVIVGKERKLAQIFKKQVNTNLSVSNIYNPFQMIGSWNILFDSESEVSSKDSNVQIVGGKISLSSGTQGIFTCSITLDNAISQVNLRTVGSNNSLVLFELSTNNGATYQTLTLEGLTNLTSSSNSLILRVTLVANTDIDSIALLFV